MITLAPVDGRTARRPGETFELEATWNIPTVAKQFEVSLFWETKGWGNPDLDEITMIDARTDKVQGTKRYQFTVPAGPWSFTGSLITLGWIVEMVADQESARYEFTVGPTDAPIVLGPPAITIAQ
jgi:hypothetical protein